MAKRMVNYDDVNSLERFTGADYLDAKNLLIYTANGANARLVIKDLNTGEEKIIASGTGECSPAFSADGTRFLYISAKNGDGRQIYVRNLDDGTEKQITHMMTGVVIDPMWSPDGTKILFASPCNGIEDESLLMENRSQDEHAAEETDVPDEDENKIRDTSRHLTPDPIVIEDFGYKFDGKGFIQPSGHMHLWVYDEQTGETHRITDGEYDYLHHNWCVDSQSIICESTRFQRKEDSLSFDLLRLSLNGAVHQLTDGLWLVSYPNPMRPVCTPDGKYAIVGALDEEVVQHMQKTQTPYPRVFLYRVALDGTGAECVFSPDEICYQCVQFPYNPGCGWGLPKLQLTEEGRYALFMAGHNGSGNLYMLDLAGDGHAEVLIDGKQVVHGIGKVQSGKCLVSLCRDDVPEIYYIYEINSGRLSEPVAQSAEDFLESVDICKPEDFSVPSLDGETIIHGWVLPPKDYDPRRKYPAILYVHGGPHPFYTYGFTPEHHALANQGFVVMWCNPRGTSSYGWEHQSLEKAMDGTAFYDCLQFVDAAIERYSYIDGERIGVTGGSYGGYMVNYMASHCHRFKAYVTQRSMVSHLIDYVSDMQGSSVQYDTFRDYMKAELKKSPVSYAEKIDRPFLILHGEDDMRTPVEGAHQLFTAIKDLHPDLPVRMVIYPHTSHEQPTHPGQWQHYYHEMVSWFKTYL